MKKPFKFFLFIISFCLLTNCNTYRESQQSLLSDQLTLTYAKKMHEEYGLHLFIYHPSISTVSNKIEVLTVNFVSNKDVNVDQARKMLLTCINSFIFEINNDKKIVSYLYHQPFTVNDIVVGIAFFDENENYYLSDQSVAYVSVINGKIFYSKTTSGNKLKDIKKETFEEAQKIVNSSH